MAKAAKAIHMQQTRQCSVRFYFFLSIGSSLFGFFFISFWPFITSRSNSVEKAPKSKWEHAGNVPSEHPGTCTEKKSSEYVVVFFHSRWYFFSS